jgi:TrmH family RNA methyltransferase
LARPAERAKSGLVLVEGPAACREAARSGLLVDLYLSADAARRLPEVPDSVEAAGGYLHECSPEYVAAISAAAQGAVGVARDPWFGEGAAGWLAGAGQISLVAVFEQIRDPGNAGTAIRAADAAGANAVVFTDGSVDPTAPKVIRSSVGSYFHLPVLRGGAAEELVGELRAAGLRVLAADAAGPTPLPEADLTVPTAWLFGNETAGLSQAAGAQADQVVAIPIYGQAESLNLAMAATVCLYASAQAHRGR